MKLNYILFQYTMTNANTILQLHIIIRTEILIIILIESNEILGNWT